MADWICDLCKEYQSGIACTYCDDGSEFNKMSNADKIRAMNDLELAEFLYGTDHYVDDSECIVCFSETRLHDRKEDILQWLKSEAE